MKIVILIIGFALGVCTSFLIITKEKNASSQQMEEAIRAIQTTVGKENLTEADWRGIWESTLKSNGQMEEEFDLFELGAAASSEKIISSGEDLPIGVKRISMMYIDHFSKSYEAGTKYGKFQDHADILYSKASEILKAEPDGSGQPIVSATP